MPLNKETKPIYIYMYMCVRVCGNKQTGVSYIFGVIDDFLFIYLFIFANTRFDFNFACIQK